MVRNSRNYNFISTDKPMLCSFLLEFLLRRGSNNGYQTSVG